MQGSRSEIRTVNWEEISKDGHLSLKALNLFLVSSAVKNAEQLGFGYSNLVKNNSSWVLYKLKIKIERLPILNENIKVVTWPRELAGISASREFQIFSAESNELIVTASSDWLIIDLTSRKPQRMSRFMNSEYLNPGKMALNENFPEFNSKCQFKEIFKVKTQYSDLDLNGHVIASKYFEWLENAVFQTYEEIKIDFLQMDYLHECHINEEVSIRICPDDKTSFVGIKTKNNKLAFRAIVKLKD